MAVGDDSTPSVPKRILNRNRDSDNDGTKRPKVNPDPPEFSEDKPTYQHDVVEGGGVIHHIWHEVIPHPLHAIYEDFLKLKFYTLALVYLHVTVTILFGVSCIKYLLFR